MSDLLAMSLAGSAVVGLILLLRPVTVKIFPAKWQYRIGKLAIAFFLIPVSLLAGKLPSVQPAAIENYSSEPFIIQRVSPANGFADTMDTVDAAIEKHLSVEVMQVILFIWLAGAIAFAAWHFYCYRRFTRQLRADNIPVPEDAEASALLSSCKAALGIHGVVKLVQNRKITSPMLVGLLHPMILLPTSNMQETDLKLVLTHELTHLKRKDLWVKMLALAAGTLHWFNPFAYVLRKDVSTWGELSCDEALASEMSREERKLYGEAILNTLDIHSGINTAFCSSFCGSRKHIERRLTMLLNIKKTKKHIAVLAVAAILVIGASGVAVAAYAADNIFNSNGKSKEITTPDTLPHTDEVYHLASEQRNPFNTEDLGGINVDWTEDKTLNEASKLATNVFITQIADKYDVDMSEKTVTIQFFKDTKKGDIWLMQTADAEHEYWAIIDNKTRNILSLASATGNISYASAPISVDSTPGTLISVKLSDEYQFTPEEWQDILKQIERGEVTVEPEVNGNASAANNSSTAQKALQGGSASAYSAYSSEGGVITPDELAKVYSVYEPFGLTYDKKQNCLYYNGKLVREFIDILSSNGEALESGKFKGAMRQLNSPDGKGEVDIKAVRDYTKLDADGLGELIGVEVVK